MPVVARFRNGRYEQMSSETMMRLYDTIVPGWQEAPLHRGERLILCPLHADHEPSLRINQSKLTWHCFPCAEGGGAWDLAKRVLGQERARVALAGSSHLAPTQCSRPIQRLGGAPLPHEVQELGPVPGGWADALIRDGRIHSYGTLPVAGMCLVQLRWRNRSTGHLGQPQECIGFHGLASIPKVWTLNGDLHVKKKLNTGPADLIVSPTIAEPDGEPIDALWDTEGESDFVAALEAGLVHVLTGTTGAQSLAAHERHRDYLHRLRIGHAYVVRDADNAGMAGARRAAEWWASLGVRAQIVPPLGPPGSKADLRDFLFGRRRNMA